MSSIRANFYKIFWEEEVCMNIFSLHKEELLQKEEVTLFGQKKISYNKRIVISNELKFKNPNNVRIVEQRTDNTKNELSEQINNKVTSEKLKFDSFVQTHFGEAIDIVVEKVNAGTISQVRLVYNLLNSLNSETKLITLLKEYKVIPPNINNYNDLEQYFNKSASQIINQDLIMSTIDAIEKASDFYSNLTHQTLLEANSFYTEILFDTDKYKDRLAFLDLLYEAKIISSGKHKTFYQCLNCNEDTFKGVVTLNVKPSKVVLKCPGCSKEVFYLAPFEVNNDIYTDIVGIDGLIIVAAKYLLEKNGFTVNMNVNIPPNVEIDILAYKDDSIILHELKMFKTDTPEHTQISNIRGVINDCLKKKDGLLKSDNSMNISEIIILTNYTIDEVYRSVKESNADVIKKNKIKILSLVEYKKHISDK